MSEILKEQVDEYIGTQLECKVVSSKPETTISDMGHEVTIWNVRTDKEGAWWVATGGGLPMNLYSQDQPYYFTTDEVFSFHFGLMMRLMYSEETRPEHVVDFISREVGIAADIRRKLKLTAEKLNEAVEVEEIQAVGVMCRETLLRLIDSFSNSDIIVKNLEDFKKADFKNRIELTINTLLPGSRNKEFRKSIKDLAYGAWDLANNITHSSTRTIHEARVCLTLCTSIITSIEHLLLNYFDVLSGEQCRKCGSRDLFIAENDETDELLIVCEKCNYGYLKQF
ncbi:hypothetical protein [Desulfosporosinus lacus]|uniref:Uncharacterized protein n=1 Tax=Desulfosporosinus lacus DSM 15449 TaxID=1121420 RepID=A0A1M6DME2_9FIRM|nr:hypothetical protein [Desulfosporosinus lacus]SHI74239.1 hypothetical protein SAMN02746098_04561 [Desulfosporosinus lacus DSM 15449]